MLLVRAQACSKLLIVWLFCYIVWTLSIMPFFDWACIKSLTVCRQHFPLSFIRSLCGVVVANLGKIPSELGQLSLLEKVYLYHNRLTGS